jgi:hypothetical protein
VVAPSAHIWHTDNTDWKDLHRSLFQQNSKNFAAQKKSFLIHPIRVIRVPMRETRTWKVNFAAQKKSF